jgi:hypothetical protein
LYSLAWTLHCDARTNNFCNEGQLQIRIFPGPALKVSTNECEVRVEIHNVGRGVAPVYMPGLTLYEFFAPVPDLQRNKGYVADEFGLPMSLARSTSENEAFSFVILNGGEYYGRTFKFPLCVSVEGTVHLRAGYENEHKGPSKTVPAWMGKISTKLELRVSGK